MLFKKRVTFESLEELIEAMEELGSNLRNCREESLPVSEVPSQFLSQAGEEGFGVFNLVAVINYCEIVERALLKRTGKSKTDPRFKEALELLKAIARVWAVRGAPAPAPAKPSKGAVTPPANAKTPPK